MFNMLTRHTRYISGTRTLTILFFPPGPVFGLGLYLFMSAIPTAIIRDPAFIFEEIWYLCIFYNIWVTSISVKTAKLQR